MILSIVYPNSDVPRNKVDIRYQDGDGKAVKTPCEHLWTEDVENMF
jgi:hypothetical protein